MRRFSHFGRRTHSREKRHLDLNTVSPMQNILKKINATGFLLLRNWKPELTTNQIADCLGIPIHINSLLPASGVQTVQALIPKQSKYAAVNHYSRSFGLGEFPLHSDLAHWAVPPRYFALRCLHGSPTVSTHLLPSDVLTSAIGNLARKAVFIPRKRSPAGPHCPLPMLFHRHGVKGVRWDSLFLTPLNSSASEVAHAFLMKPWRNSLESVTLLNPGDTLIVDNWRMLHGRSTVDDSSGGRKIERVYLSAIQG